MSKPAAASAAGVGITHTRPCFSHSGSSVSEPRSARTPGKQRSSGMPITLPDEIVGPGMIGAGEDAGLAAALRHLGAAVPAHVEERAQLAVAVARDEDRHAGIIVGAEGAGPGPLRGKAHQQRVLAEQDLPARVPDAADRCRPTRRCARARRPGAWSWCRRSAAAASRGRSALAGPSRPPCLSVAGAPHRMCDVQAANRRSHALRRASASDTVPYHARRRRAIRCRITIQRAGMEADDGTARWIEAGLAELAKGGIDRVRVEVLADQPRRDQGRLLPSLQGPPGAARRAAGDVGARSHRGARKADRARRRRAHASASSR